MNDPYDAGYGDGGAGPYELVGYDEYGRPVYRQAAAQPAEQQPYAGYDTPAPYGHQDQYGRQDQYGQADQYGQHEQRYGQQEQYGQQGHGYDPYAQDARQSAPPYEPYEPYGGYGAGPQQSAPAYDPYASGTRAYDDPYDPAGGRTAAGGGQPRTAEQTAYIPQQAGPPEEARPHPADGHRTPAADEPEHPSGRPEHPSGQDEHDSGQPEYRTEQFAFVEEPDDGSEDVIDWLKFTENRTERREEARRRARARVIALAVVLALVAVGGVGYLWFAGKLPGASSSDGSAGGTTAAGAQKRDVLVVHLHDTDGGGTTTALLVDNTTTKRGTTVLLPNSLALTGEDGTPATLARTVDEAGPDATRTALDSALGTDIEGTWRLDTPYLEILVDLVGNIEVDTDTDVPDPEAEDKGAAPLVRKGENQTLSGKTAVAYATYRGPGEGQNAQLQRFGQVLQGVLRKLSSDPQGATTTVETLGLILDPPLTEKDLGTFLASLADRAKGGDYDTTLLPVEADGSLSPEASDSVVEDVLGGTANSPDEDAAVSVSVRNATGDADNTGKARVVLLNGGFTFRQAGTAPSAQATSEVVYADEADKENAVEVAKTLGLPAGAVTRGEVAGNADVGVVLGQDYRPSS